MPKKSNETLSLGKSEIVHGIEVKKMPCGKYFEALQELKNLPSDFIKEVSNGVEFRLSDMFDLENLINLVSQLMIIAPKFLFKFLSKLLDVNEKVLRDQLTPDELLEVCIKFWEVNNLENFFNQAKSIMIKAIQKIGFKEQLQSVLK